MQTQKTLRVTYTKQEVEEILKNNYLTLVNVPDDTGIEIVFTGGKMNPAEHKIMLIKLVYEASKNLGPDKPSLAWAKQFVESYFQI